MKIPFVTPLLARLGRRRLRRINRGYRTLKATGRLSLVVELKEALTNAHFAAEAEQASAAIFGAGRKDAEIIIRQYLLVRVAGLNLNKALLASLGGGGGVVHPLPARWRQIVRTHGFAVAGFRCAVWWQAYVVCWGAYGLWLCMGRSLAGLRESRTRSFPAMGRYAYFDALVCGNLPQPDADGRSHDILSWYRQWPERAADLTALAHSVRSVPAGMIEGMRVQPVTHPIPPLSRAGDLARFLAWALAAGGRAMGDLLRGRWWHALLLSESVKAAQIRLADPARLARDYLFHNSNWIYRPLWTYEAEARGSRIIFYFYSTNCESLKTSGGYGIQANSWQASNWPLYLVWDNDQADFVHRAKGGQAPVKVTGPIWFFASSVEVPVLPARTIAVFDVQPVRLTFYRTLGLPIDYYTAETVIQFLREIHDGVQRCGAMLALKRKRKIGRLVHPAYRRFVEHLDTAGNFLAVDPDTSAWSVIEKSGAVISMPFTSTALIARALGKPSCYYDPTGVILKDDRAAHGIEIIRGREELARWLGSVVGAARPGQSPGTPEAAKGPGKE